MGDARSESGLLWPVRATAAVVVAAVALFVALELCATGGIPGPQLACHLAAGLAAAGALLATRTAAGRARADQIALALTVVVGLMAIVYVRLVPGSAGVIASLLVSLLVGTTVIAGWSVERAVAAGVLACAGFAVAAGLGANAAPLPFAFALASLSVGAGVAIACASGLAQGRAGLARRQRELRDLSARLMSVHEEERQRLSRELHDGLGQSLTAVLSYLWLIERQVPESTPELRGRVAEARRLASTTLAQIRELSQRLRPSVLDDYGLVPSLEAHVKAFGDRQAIVTTFHADGVPERLSSEIETAVFRITQEALGNVARHARARHVHVSLGVEGRELRLEVHDDGIGVDAARGTGSAGTGMGLIGIRERVRALGGHLSLTSEEGARLEVRLPLPAEAEAPAA